MQDRYALDVGDFGKAGLLRALVQPPWSLGVVWYMAEDRGPAGDGKHVSYLGDAGRYRGCDPALFDAFKAELGRGHGPRSVARLEGLGVLPGGPRFTESVQPGRRREAWFARALGAVRGSDVVFCDPDNGVANPGSLSERIGSVKHALLGEVGQLYAAGHSVVVYHHLSRERGHADQVECWRARLAEVAGPVASAWFRRGSARVFFVAPQPRHHGRVLTALSLLSESEWCLREHVVVGSPS